MPIIARPRPAAPVQALRCPQAQRVARTASLQVLATTDLPHRSILTEILIGPRSVAALWRPDVGLRGGTFWKLLYERAARADEVLCLTVEDRYPQDKRGRITAKGGAAEWIGRRSGTAQVLPCLISGRTRGLLFLTDRETPAGTPALDRRARPGVDAVAPHVAERDPAARRWT
jgi:hypothetical protein